MLKEFVEQFDSDIITIDEAGKGTSMLTVNLLDEEVLKEMSKKYNKTLGQIALNWSISQGVIVIPRTSSTERMKENLLSTSFKMKDEDIEKIGQLNRNFHFCSSLNWKSFNGIDVFA